ncbi:MAG: hypothetical protein Q8P75_03260 [bacterium]|nr:hypothetical protein [bacterium]
MRQEILEYIRKCQALGMSDGAIGTSLKNAGWDEAAISQAWAEIKNPTPTAILGATNAENAVLENGELSFWDKHKKLILGTAISLVILSGGGYFAYAQYYSNPERVWTAATQKALSLQSGHVRIEGSYVDRVKNKDENFLTESITVSLSSEGDFSVAQNNQPDFAIKTNASIKMGDINLGVDGESRKLGDNLYYKISGIPFLGSLFAGSDNQKHDWIKIDLNKQQEFSEEQIKQIQNAFVQVQIFKPEKLLGTEKVNEKSAWHYQASVDKVELRKYLETTLRIIDSEKDWNKEIGPFMDKLDFHTMEVWIGKWDRQIYQVYLETNFPSVLNAALAPAEEKSRDAQRVADIRQIMTALELFYNDNDRYPKAANGFPDYDDGKPKFSTFMAAIPNAPKPADGTCGEQDNLYWYEQKDNGKNYSLRFCLGNATGGLSAGLSEASKTGISISYLTPPPPPLPILEKNPVEDIPFTGTFGLKINLSNFNQPVTIEEPQGAVDYSKQQINTEEINNVGKIMTLLELYYNEYDNYPPNLNLLEQVGKTQTTYDAGIPKFNNEKPQNTTGECSGVREDFNYLQLEDGQSYSLEFCLTQDSGGYKQGKHKASPAGIE